MNKPLLAAITGVAFGVTLTGAIIHFRNTTRTRTCHRAWMVHRTVVQPPQTVAQPREEIVPVREREPSCPRLVDEPLDVDSQLSEAQTEYVNGDYECARSMAQKVSQQNPVRAWRIIGASSCNLRDVKMVNTTYKHLDAPARQYLLYVCQRSGIQWHKRGFRLAE